MPIVVIYWQSSLTLQAPVFDVGLYYTPSWAEGWKASFVMDNLLDRDY